MRISVTKGEELRTPGKLAARFLIPFIYVAISILLDIVLFASLRWTLTGYYSFSLLIIIAFAVLMALIPSRTAQTMVFSFILSVKSLLIISTILAYQNLGEIFIWENLRAIGEILLGRQASDVNLFAVIMSTIPFVVFFTIVAFFITYRYRNIKAGFRLKGVIAGGLVFIV